MPLNLCQQQTATGNYPATFKLITAMNFMLAVKTTLKYTINTQLYQKNVNFKFL